MEENYYLETLLSREASMSSMSLGIGLTYLGKYDYSYTGFFYNSIFSLTTGIERILKLIMIYDFRLSNNDKFLENQHLKNFGHNLKNLYEQAIEIKDKHSFKIHSDFYNTDKIYKAILEIFTDFALQARYYSLDYLSGIKQKKEEPLIRWDKEVCKIIIDRHHKFDAKKIEKINKLADFFSEFSIVEFTSESGQNINTMKDMLYRSEYIKVKQKFSVYYVYILIRFLCFLLVELEFKGNFYPNLRELFGIFRISNKTEILRKKSWNPYPPYHF